MVVSALMDAAVALVDAKEKDDDRKGQAEVPDHGFDEGPVGVYRYPDITGKCKTYMLGNGRTFAF